MGLNPPNASVVIEGGPIPCDGLPHVRTVTVDIDADAPPLARSFGILGANPTGASCSTVGTITVAGVGDLKWGEFDRAQSTPLESPDPNNGGVRMFPGKAAAVDAFEADRRKVDLVATVNPVVAGCTVYFRVWDVDDPFDQNNAGIANVNLIDADTSGPDNRPVGAADSGVGQWQGVTDANGVARVTIEVSMQPGNNYRAGASLMLNGVADSTVTQADADANMPPFGVTFSDMLTIWRKLHVETDSMVRPSFSQNTYMMDWNQPTAGPVASQVIVEVDDPPTDGSDTKDEQFTGGFIELRDGVGSSLVVARILQYTTHGFPDSFVDDELLINIPTCAGGLSGLACLGGVTSGGATLSDDDLSDEMTFRAQLWGCDDLYSGGGADLLPPDLSALELRYGPGCMTNISQRGHNEYRPTRAEIIITSGRPGCNRHRGTKIFNKTVPRPRQVCADSPPNTRQCHS